MERNDKLNLINSKEEQPWYHAGLRFECTGCGKCCTGSPGYVWVTEEEINAIAAYLKLPVDKFKRMYTRVKDGQNALTEKRAPYYDCIFLHDKKCTIYPVRPKQCGTFPFWKGLLSSKENWEEAAKSCEGIRDGAPLIAMQEIQARLVD